MNLIEKIQKKYNNVKEIEPTIIRGFDKTITIRNYRLKVNKNNIFVFNIFLCEKHDGLNTIENHLTVSVANAGEFKDDAIEMFSIQEENQFFDFLKIVL